MVFPYEIYGGRLFSYFRKENYYFPLFILKMDNFGGFMIFVIGCLYLFIKKDCMFSDNTWVF